MIRVTRTGPVCVENVLCDAGTLQEKEEAAAEAVLGKVNSSLLNNC